MDASHYSDRAPRAADQILTLHSPAVVDYAALEVRIVKNRARAASSPQLRFNFEFLPGARPERRPRTRRERRELNARRVREAEREHAEARRHGVTVEELRLARDAEARLRRSSLAGLFDAGGTRTGRLSSAGPNLSGPRQAPVRVETFEQFCAVFGGYVP